MTRFTTATIALIVLALPMAMPAHAEADAGRGASAFRLCASCHTLTEGEHITGPSLAHVIGRKAGSVAGFGRYSPALKARDFTWNAATLDAWLRAPARMVPGNWMTFEGIPDDQVRVDLIAYLEAVSSGAVQAPAPPQRTKLSTIGDEYRVASINHCGDSYRLTTAAGRSMTFWEPNLRFKTDSGKFGPAPGKPVILPTGMMGDRAQVVFAKPTEISAFIGSVCDPKG